MSSNTRFLLLSVFSALLCNGCLCFFQNTRDGLGCPEFLRPAPEHLPIYQLEVNKCFRHGDDPDSHSECHDGRVYLDGLVNIRIRPHTPVKDVGSIKVSLWVEQWGKYYKSPWVPLVHDTGTIETRGPANEVFGGMDLGRGKARLYAVIYRDKEPQVPQDLSTVGKPGTAIVEQEIGIVPPK